MTSLPGDWTHSLAFGTNPPGMPTVLDEMSVLSKYIHLDETVDQTMVFKLPSRYRICYHPPEAPLETQAVLGEGTFGVVRGISRAHVSKCFIDGDSFYHELIAGDLVSVAKLMHPGFAGLAMITPVTACAVCKEIFYPRFSSSLADHRVWEGSQISSLTTEFESLLEAVNFLHSKCGMFHSDISVENILVKIDSNPNSFGTLVLADLGVFGFHSGSPSQDVVIKSQRGKTLYSLCSEKTYFDICKDTFKPAAVLARCYVNVIHCPRDEGEALVVHWRAAQIIDVACLGNCLLWCIEKFLDACHINPTRQCQEHSPETRITPAYYLQFLAPRVALCGFLSRLWNYGLDLGVDCQGLSSGVFIRREDAVKFQSWCKVYNSLLNSTLTLESTEAVRNLHLAVLTQELLKCDRFVL